MGCLTALSGQHTWVGGPPRQPAHTAPPACIHKPGRKHARFRHMWLPAIVVVSKAMLAVPTGLPRHQRRDTVLSRRSPTSARDSAS